MKMLIIKSMDFLVLFVALAALLIGFLTREPIVILACALFAVVWSSLWCVLSSIACDVRAIREKQ